MGNKTTLLLLTALCIVITSAVIIQGEKVKKNGGTLDPPQLRMVVGNQSIPGILGTYCRRYENDEEDCVEKFPPEQITTRATLVSKKVSSEEKIRFEVLDYKKPRLVNYKVLNKEGNKIIEATQNHEGFKLEREGEFLIVADVYWKNRRIRYTYQIRTK